MQCIIKVLQIDIVMKDKCIYRTVNLGEGGRVNSSASYLGEVLQCGGTTCDIQLITGKQTTVRKKDVEIISKEHFNRLAEMWERSERKQAMTPGQTHLNSPENIRHIFNFS